MNLLLMTPSTMVRPSCSSDQLLNFPEESVSSSTSMTLYAMLSLDLFTCWRMLMLADASSERILARTPALFSFTMAMRTVVSERASRRVSGKLTELTMSPFSRNFWMVLLAMVAAASSASSVDAPRWGRMRVWGWSYRRSSGKSETYTPEFSPESNQSFMASESTSSPLAKLHMTRFFFALMSRSLPMMPCVPPSLGGLLMYGMLRLT
mmetsp:Transcript_23135/g.48022  ORF Transcript_23135/g.48022 Transcript_23135/m.48022 type:complete len:208 (-) Transcript_23135:788-1411(-)